MTASDTAALVVALVANVLGVVVVLRMWARSRRRRFASSTRHPAVRPPVSVDLVDAPPWARLRVTVPRGAPPVAVDIVSYRRASPPGPWEIEPLVAPVVLEPGASALLTASLPPESAVDVVVAWTARHPTGDVQGSRVFRLPADREVPAAAPPPAGTLTGRWAVVATALVSAAMLIVAWSWLGDDDRTDDGIDDRTDDVAAITTASSEPTPPTVPPTSSTVAPAPATSRLPSTLPATAPPTTAPASTAPLTTVPGTPVPTTTVPGTTSVGGSTPRVIATARLGPCRFADECLIVGFTLDGFATAPQQYVCEFEDGSRFTFRFDSGGVDDACATGTPTAEITVEVDGVRSETLTRTDADPA